MKKITYAASAMIAGSAIIGLLIVMFFFPKKSIYNAQVIIVLGAQPYSGKSYNACLTARLDATHYLYREHVASKIILSGKGPNQKSSEPTESMVMKDYLQSKGVATEDMFTETNSTSTYENLVNSQNIMNDKGYTSAIIVTDSIHRLRASLVAHKLGLQYQIYIAENSPCASNILLAFPYCIREALGIVMYVFTGKI